MLEPEVFKVNLATFEGIISVVLKVFHKFEEEGMLLNTSMTSKLEYLNLSKTLKKRKIETSKLYGPHHTHKHSLHKV